MKFPTLLSRFVLVLGSVLLVGTGCGAAEVARSPSREELIPTEAEKDSRLGWWREARFGMFVHWGVYSALSGTWQGKKYGGYGEHIQRMAKIPIPVYRREVAGSFNPTEFNADEWIRLAKEAGMGYFVITAKHHDGFAMYDSQVSDYNIVKATPFARDPMKELRVACAKYGVKFGFYYSHAFDWGEDNGPGNDWDYQNPGGDKLLNGSEWWLKDKEFLPKARKYVDEKSIPHHLGIMCVRRRERNRERYALLIDHEVVFGTDFPSVGRITPRLGPPFGAATAEPSSATRSHCTRSSRWRASNSARHTFGHTPASCHATNRRQHVVPEPQPSSRGNSPHGSPCRKTNNIPVRAARSSTRGRPPRFFPRRFCSGRCGAMIAHNSSDSSSAIPPPINFHPRRPGAGF